MAKKYTAQEILDMAVGLIESDPAADLDFDGRITSSDARYASRQEAGLKPLDTNSLMSENILNKIINNTSSFSYDADADELYSQYKSLYEREADKASEDAMGLASTLTGGYSNSYGLMKARQERDRYADKLLETRKGLENQAYARHLDSLDSLYSLYGLLNDVEKSEEDKQKAALEFAVAAADMGDNSFLEALGITPAEKKEDMSAVYDKAELFAKYGDYSLLRELGVDVSSLTKDELQELAEFFAKYGDYSILKGLGVDTSDREADEYYDRLIKKYKAGL